MVDEDQALTSPEVCELAGVTYRQLDYWARRGYVTPSVRDADGSGTLRLWSPGDLEEVRQVAAIRNRARELHNRSVSSP